MKKANKIFLSLEPPKVRFILMLIIVLFSSISIIKTVHASPDPAGYLEYVWTQEISSTRRLFFDTLHDAPGTGVRISYVQGWATSDSPRKMVRTSNGTIYVAYNKHLSGKYQIFVIKSTDNGATWINNTLISTYSGMGGYTQASMSIAVDSNDYLHVVWYGKATGFTLGNQIWYNNNTNSWGTPIRLSTHAGASNSECWWGCIAIDSNDYSHVVYYSTTNKAVWYTNRTTSWGDPFCISTYDGQEESGNQQAMPVIAIDSNDYLHVLWDGQTDSSGGYWWMWYNKYTTSWAGAVLISTAPGMESSSHAYPSIAIDSNDYLHTAWYGKATGFTSDHQVWYNKYTTSWAGPVRISTFPDMENYAQLSPSVAIDSSDNVHVVWYGRDMGISVYEEIWYNWYNTSWATPIVIQSEGDNHNPQLRWSKWHMLPLPPPPVPPNPTITYVIVTDMDDNDNCYEMESYYSFVVVANDPDGIDMVYLQGTQVEEVRFEVRATNLTGTPAYAIQTGSTIIDLDTESCSWTEDGNEGTATFKIRFEWDFTDEVNLELRVYAEDSGANSTGFDTEQTNYFDVLGRLVTENLAVADGRINKGASTTLSGNVRYSTTISGNTASSSYPPDAQFTSVDIHDSGHVERGMDDVIVNGLFSASFNIPNTVQSNTYHIYLDMVADYSDADAPDVDTTNVIGDCIKILTLEANNTTPAKNESVLLNATAELEFDNHVLGAGDNLTLEELAFTWNATSTQWELVAVSADSETRTYNEFTNGTEVTYNITLGDINGQTVSVTWGEAPTITSASIPDMDDTDNIYTMKRYYTFVTVVNDVEGATNISKVYLRIKNGDGVVGEFRATNLTGTPAWAIQTGDTVFDLDEGSCVWSEDVNEGTATFKIRAEWDITQYNDMDIEVYVENSVGGYANFTDMQMNYVDLISRLVTPSFGSNVTSTKVNSPIQIFGSVRYATTTDGNLASSSYPPYEQFTSVKIRNDQAEIVAIDTTIASGVFNVTFNASSIIRATYYFVWLDLLDDYVDGLAPDGDYVLVSTTSGFYLSWLIDRAFSFFGIGNYLSQIFVYGSALGTYFADSISNLLLLIVQQFRLALSIFGFFINWYTRMVNLLIAIGTAITGLLDGTGSITTGLGNIWDFIAFGTWIDIVPIIFFIWWVESIATRGETQGEISVFLGDIQTVMNITSWFLSMFSLVINTMTDLAFRLMEVIT